jgi:MFS family permease
MTSQEKSTTESSVHPLLSRRYRIWLVGVLLLVNALNFADRAVLSVLAQSIKEDLQLTDAQLGILHGLGFAILYSVLGLPLGWLAERVSRKGLIAACVALWSLMTAACGYAAGFGSLLLGRIGVGVGEAGFQPSAYSLLADHFKANRRASIIAIVMLGSPLGFLIGQSVGGWVASQWSWRVAFIAMGLPGLLVSLLVWLTLREPPRGLAEGSTSTARPPALRTVFATLWSKPTFRHVLIAGTISGFTLNAVAQFVLPFYLRGFGLPLAGGFGVDRLTRRDPRWAMWLPALSVLLAGPFYFAAFASRQTAVSLTMIWLANFTLITYMAPTLAAPQNLVGPRMRAVSAAVFAMVVGLIGAGFGPWVLGLASDFFAGQAYGAGDFISACPGGRAPDGAAAGLDEACRTASFTGLRHALMSMLVFFAWASVHFLLAARTVRQDLYVPGRDE